MEKHYYQDHPLRQSNSFVVFPDFFQHVNAFLAPRSRGARSVYPPIQSTLSRCSSTSCLSSKSSGTELPPSPSQPPKRSSSLSSPPPVGVPCSAKRTTSASTTQEISSHIPKLRSRGDGGIGGQGLASKYCKRLE